MGNPKIYQYVKERKKRGNKEKYPWLDPSNKRKYILDREILKNVNLEIYCLTDKEKNQVKDMLYKYNKAFSLRDEIGTWVNIEVEIDVTDKSPSFIRPYHVNKEDKISYTKR